VLGAVVLVAAACSRAASPPAGTSPTTAGAGDGGAAQTRDTTDRLRTATSSEWSGRNVGRAEELLAGRFPGVRVLNVPGQGISVSIRGASTFTGSTQPLYVVDGVPYATDGNGLLSINPNDIAKIEVLKDAARLAEYGVRGANGVVLIATKRGKD
jgi:TonB-dependent SusC/RagA subfamily outer membrane receptor